MSTDLQAAALRYAEQGWAIFPVHWPQDGQCSCQDPQCPSPAKHPRTDHGFHEATTDAATIARWWTQWPDANIGHVPGQSGHLVTDIDSLEGQAAAQRLGLLAEPTL